MTTLPKTLFDEIERHGRDAYPEECVGALIGTLAVGGNARTVERLFPIDNRSEENRERRYLVSPLAYLAAERAADGAGKTLLGFYHSHPEHPAEPSATDLAWAQPHFVYVIMSIRRSGDAEPAAAGAGAFLLDPDRSGFLTDELAVVRP
ncbi:MAG: M67 family metallopeptidase [Spirochaetaceae bacterium]|nr:M67 family metallopeptidase [Spirochaetaceae bacterium]